MIDLTKVGASPKKTSGNKWTVNFGIYLPGITPDKGYQLKVRVIHEKDQFIRAIQPEVHDLSLAPGSQYDLWQAKVNINPVPNTNYGQVGKYHYRFQLIKNNRPIVYWFSDPFGRESGLGTLSSFILDPVATPFNWTDAAFKVPHLDDMIVYEMHAGEFNGTFTGIKRQLDYLLSLGINVIEIMPFTNVKESVEWGYTPLGYFAPDERFGGSLDLKNLVDSCHQKGIAVIMDAVYAHAHPEFAYNIIFKITGEPNPMMGYFEGEFFADPGTDYNKPFTQEYFLTLYGWGSGLEL